MLLSHAQCPSATASLVVRDEEAAGSNPVTPTTPAGLRCDVGAGPPPAPVSHCILRPGEGHPASRLGMADPVAQHGPSGHSDSPSATKAARSERRLARKQQRSCSPASPSCSWPQRAPPPRQIQASVANDLHVVVGSMSPKASEFDVGHQRRSWTPFAYELVARSHIVGSVTPEALDRMEHPEWSLVPGVKG